MKLLWAVVLFIALCLGSGWALAAPMRGPICDARLVAENMKGLTQAQFVEVVDVLEAQGAIDRTYAEELRAFISQAYAAPDVGAWVRVECSSKEKV